MKQVFRTFWTGSLGPYRHLCFRSFLHHGHALEVFTYDEGLVVPDGVRLRDAREIMPRGEVLRYDGARSFGSGSPALHSDLFRYGLLEKLGGWWVDCDVILLRPEVPSGDLFIANESAHLLGSAVLRAPKGHPLFSSAARTAAGARPSTLWGEVGPILLTRLVAELGLESLVAARSTAFEIGFHETWKLFEPGRRAEVEQRLHFSPFCHLWDQGWRAAGIAEQLAPPRGSFLDGLCRKFGVLPLFSGRLQLDSVHALAGFEPVPDGRAKPLAAIENFRSAVLNVSILLDEQAPEQTDEVRKGLSALWSAADRIEESAGRMSQELVALRARLGSLTAGRAASASTHAPAAQPGNVAAAPSVPQRHVFRCFWHGSALSPYEKLSIASLQSRGHHVVLYRYDPAIAVPAGVEVADAREFLPAEAVQARATGSGRGSFAPHAEILRMLLMEATGDWWIDLDTVLLAAAVPPDPMVIFRHSDTELVNAAVARMPAGAPVLRELLSYIDLSTFADAEWGSVNPELFTEMLKAFGLDGQARPALQAFPVAYWEFEKLLLPSARAEVEELCRDAIFVHFWNDRLRRSGVPKWMAPPVGSYLDELFRRFEIAFPPGDSLPSEQIVTWSANLRALDAERARTTSKEQKAQLLRREIAALTTRISMLEAERSLLPSRGGLAPDLSKPEALRPRR